MRGAGDGLQPRPAQHLRGSEDSVVSHTAIAAVLARDDLSIGERLAALSLASYANR